MNMQMSHPSVIMTPSHAALFNSIETMPFVQGYIDAMLRCSYVEGRSAADLTEAALGKIVLDCHYFQTSMAEYLGRGEMCDLEQCGEDFWMSRHALQGFLSHGYDPLVALTLFNAAIKFGAVRLYITPEGQLEITH